MDEERPRTDDRDPGDVISTSIDHVLSLVETWPAWDGTPRPVDDRVYTPHKAVRRVADHLIDHLAQVEARIGGEPALPDRWHASAVTTASDLAPFTRDDVDEARSRLSRLAQIWSIRLRSIPPQELDRTPEGDWSIREIVHHVAESTYYADAVGRLEGAS